MIKLHRMTCTAMWRVHSVALLFYLEDLQQSCGVCEYSSNTDDTRLLTRVVFIRSLSLHLQICWQIVPGRKFFLGSLAAGWLIPALSLGLSLGLSGVSYRFGNICHINHKRSLGTFWVPILVFTGSAAILQFITFGYCVRVYVRSLMDPNTTSGASSNAPSALPSFQGSSIKTMSARATYRRVKKVIALQWRGIMVVIVLLISVVYFATVFITLDEKTSNEAENFSSIEPWLLCLVTNNGDKNKCLNLAGALILNEPTVLTVLYLLSVRKLLCCCGPGSLTL